MEFVVAILSSASVGAAVEVAILRVSYLPNHADVYSCFSLPKFDSEAVAFDLHSAF